LFAILGISWLDRGHTVPACIAFVAALLGRETAILLIGPYLLTGTRRVGMPRWIPGLVVVALWQVWVLAVRLWIHGSPLPRKWPWPVPLAGHLTTRSFDLRLR